MERQPEAGAWQVGGAVDGWWDRERAVFLSERLEDRLSSSGLVIDVGCGWGSFAQRISNETQGFTVGCDYAPYPDWKNVPGDIAFVVCDARRLPFRSDRFDLTLALDVIEHFPDDQAPLKEIERITRGGGAVGLAVPALPWLWSKFDVSVGHYRRYRAGGLETACRRAGLNPADITYFFSWLVVPAWLLRGRDRRDADRVRAGRAGRMLDRGVAAVCRAERAWLRRRRLPVGTSLWALAVRPGARGS